MNYKEKNSLYKIIPAAAYRKAVFAVEDIARGEVPSLRRSGDTGVDVRKVIVTATGGDHDDTVKVRVHACASGMDTDVRMDAYLEAGDEGYEITSIFADGTTCSGRRYQINTALGLVYADGMETSETFWPKLLGALRHRPEEWAVSVNPDLADYGQGKLINLDEAAEIVEAEPEVEPEVREPQTAQPFGVDF